MRELIIQAQTAGVDPDRIQGCVSREDWEGLHGAVAEKQRARREEIAAQQEAAVAAAARTDEETNTVLGRLAADLRAGTERLRAAIG